MKRRSDGDLVGGMCGQCVWFKRLYGAIGQTGTCLLEQSDFFELEIRPEYKGCSKWERA
jgi:hypothetical protein